jgi:hypothetical protein
MTRPGPKNHQAKIQKIWLFLHRKDSEFELQRSASCGCGSTAYCYLTIRPMVCLTSPWWLIALEAHNVLYGQVDEPEVAEVALANQ